MKVFVCGKGHVAPTIVSLLGRRDDVSQVAFFTHSGAYDSNQIYDGMCEYATTESVNSISAWPFFPDVTISIGYLDIIKQPALDLLGMAVNCHYSLLPNHRGRSPVPWAIFDGDSITGISWHLIDDRIDTGRVFFQLTTQITKNETALSLFMKLDELAIYSFSSVFEMARSGYAGVSSVPQSLLGSKTSYHKAGPPFNGVINDEWDYDTIERFIRAMTYPPLPLAKTRGGVEVGTIEEYIRLKVRLEERRVWGHLTTKEIEKNIRSLFGGSDQT